MDNDKRSALEQRRKHLQIKIQAEAYIIRHIKSARELFDDLHQKQVSYKIIGLINTPVDYLEEVIRTICQPTYRTYGFHEKHINNKALEKQLDVLYEKHPSIHPFRYMPELIKYADYYRDLLPEGTFRDGLRKTVEAVGLIEQKVYLYYLQYTLVLEVSLASICANDHEDIFNTWHGEVMIFDHQADWLITFTLEEEWLGGRK